MVSNAIYSSLALQNTTVSYYQAMIRQVNPTKADEAEIDTFFGKMLAPRLNSEERHSYEEEEEERCLYLEDRGTTCWD